MDFFSPIHLRSFLLSGVICASVLYAGPVEDILSETEYPSFEKRHLALHALSQTVFENHTQRFFDFLKRKTAPPHMEANDFLSLKNDVANYLITYDLFPVAHLEHALMTISDPEENFIWRDYYIQKIPSMLEGSQIPEADMLKALSLLEKYAAQQEPGLTGTALIAAYTLSHANKTADHFKQQTLSKLAINCAQNPRAILIDRVTALQIAAMLKNPDAFDLAVEWLGHENNVEIPIMLKVSALASLQYSGDTSLLPYAEKYRLSPDIRLRAAARGSIESLSKTSTFKLNKK